MSYIRGAYARASCSLIDELHRLGVIATVGYPERKRDGTLIVRISKGDASKVPAEWEGFKTRMDGVVR
jgi:hypothetical protein